MNRIGFPKSRMDEEKRIALLPRDIATLQHPNNLFFQLGYGSDLGISDSDFREVGARVVSEERTRSLEILCQPKFLEEDLPDIVNEQVVFGWLHLTEEDRLAKALDRRDVTAIDWGVMTKEDGGNVFQDNGYITGLVGVMHAMPYAGKLPEECNVAIIGRSRVGKGAFDQLKKLGTEKITVYHTENWGNLKKWIGNYDVVVHCACSERTILAKEDLKRMKRGALFIHLGSDSIEGNYNANSIYSPVTLINRGQNAVYCVNHVPTLVYRSASSTISRDVAPFIDTLIEGRLDDTLKEAIIVGNGEPYLSH